MEATPPRKSNREEEALAREAKAILRAHMARRGYSYKRLAASLDPRDGPVEDVQTLINKINRGRFSFALMLRLCRAMGVQSLDLTPVPTEVAEGEETLSPSSPLDTEFR